MSQINSKERIHWIDVAKGILILLLLIHHFTPATDYLGIDKHPFHFFYCWTIIFTCFFMQAFFFMSGYCSNFQKQARPFFYGLFKQLVVPFICFELLICIYYTRSLDMVCVYSFWIKSEGTHLWFLNALLVSKIFVWCCVRITNKSKYLLLITLLLLVVAVGLKQFHIGSDFLCVKQSLGSAFFVALGYVCKSESFLLKIRKLGDYFPYILLLLLLFDIKIPTFMGSMKVTLISLPVLLATTISGTMALINVCKKIESNRFLEFYGKNSIVVYCCHFISLLLLLDFFLGHFEPAHFGERLLLIVAVYIVEVIVMGGLIWLFKYKPFCWLIGKF